ncbi:ferrous iron transport protein A [Bifidobacterium pullorum subsp. saeculare]|uniref:Ferrous iron transport protein A n=1 Tax=Bifidobacterium pullorum subsp. saeculare TaxID=78257 RepID=A0A939B9X1_9BIFI|nr:FeoA family protein [Bifidobacterium pullorum]MBM6699276.1 ferrous iron transport protein A [Bifidobacterium pullorum subsp. saeculare]
MAKTSEPTTLRDCPLRADLVVTGIDLDERHRFRLLELGLRVGTVLRVVQRGNFGGRVVARGSERIALDGGTARAIRVRPAGGAGSDA